MQISNICVHHSGGIGTDNRASSQYLKAQDVDRAHKNRWNFISSLGYYGGYNFFIDKTGEITQFRAIGEETAAQAGHNFDTVSICLAGNFSGVDKPTKEQIESLKFIMISLLEKKHTFKVNPNTEINIGWGNIYPHRVLQPNHTECNGTHLPNNWARTLVAEYLSKKIGLLQKLVELYQILFSLKSKTYYGGGDRSCDGNV